MTQNNKTSACRPQFADVRAGGCVSSAPSPARLPARSNSLPHITGDDVMAHALLLLLGRIPSRRLVKLTSRLRLPGGFEVNRRAWRKRAA